MFSLKTYRLPSSKSGVCDPPYYGTSAYFEADSKKVACKISGMCVRLHAAPHAARVSLAFQNTGRQPLEHAPLCVMRALISMRFLIVT